MNISANFGIKAANKPDSAQAGGSFTAPVPMFGVYGDWEAFPHLYLRGTFQTLYINNVESYGGLIRDRRLAAEWYPYTNYGLGLGWHYIGLAVRKTGANGGYVQMNYSIQGLSAYVTAAFGARQPVAPRPSKLRIEPPPGQDFGLMPRTVSVAIGGYLPSVSSQGQLSSSSNSGTDIDLENSLGLPTSSQSLVLDAAVRVGDRSLITANYFAFSRSGSTTLTDTIHFGNGTYVPGAFVSANGGLSYFGFSYRYYFLRHPRWQIGGGIGLDELDVNASIVGIQTVAAVTDTVRRAVAVAAPAPMLGLFADWEVLRHFYLRGSAEYMSIAVSDASGSITDDRAALEWYAVKQYGIGLGYHYVALKVDKTLRTGSELKFDYLVQGPTLYLMAAF